MLGKDARFDRVADAVIRQLIRNSPQDLRYASVARRAEVSRAWLYKYFGPAKGDLVAFAARLYAEAFARIEPFPKDTSIEEFRTHLARGTRKGLADTLATPWCVELYFRYRMADHAVGQAIRDAEARHVEGLLEALPPALRRRSGDARRFAEAFTAARMGVYHRWLDPEFRARHGDEGMVREVLNMFDGFVRAETGVPKSPPAG